MYVVTYEGIELDKFGTIQENFALPSEQPRMIHENVVPFLAAIYDPIVFMVCCLSRSAELNCIIEAIELCWKSFCSPFCA